MCVIGKSVDVMSVVNFGVVIMVIGLEILLFFFCVMFFSRLILVRMDWICWFNVLLIGVSFKDWVLCLNRCMLKCFLSCVIWWLILDLIIFRCFVVVVMLLRCVIVWKLSKVGSLIVLIF